MVEVAESLRRGVVDALPEVNLIQDARLCEQVIDAWALGLSKSSFAAV